MYKEKFHKVMNDNFIKDTENFLGSINGIIEKLKNDFIQKYGNKEKVDKYIDCLMRKDQEGADKILKELENGK